MTDPSRKNFVIVYDPNGYFRPGACFNKPDLIDMLNNEYISPEMIVYSKVAQSKMKVSEIRPPRRKLGIDND